MNFEVQSLAVIRVLKLKHIWVLCSRTMIRNTSANPPLSGSKRERVESEYCTEKPWELLLLCWWKQDLEMRFKEEASHSVCVSVCVRFTPPQCQASVLHLCPEYKWEAERWLCLGCWFGSFFLMMFFFCLRHWIRSQVMVETCHQ